MPSPFFMPVSAKTQWSGCVQMKSAPPVTGAMFRAPTNSPELGLL
jgi:hypothetical protein